MRIIDWSSDVCSSDLWLCCPQRYRGQSGADCGQATGGNECASVDHGPPPVVPVKHTPGPNKVVGVRPPLPLRYAYEPQQVRSLMRSGNPALNANTFLDASTGRVVSAGDNAMTINGTVNKTGKIGRDHV